MFVSISKNWTVLSFVCQLWKGLCQLKVCRAGVSGSVEGFEWKKIILKNWDWHRWDFKSKQELFSNVRSSVFLEKQDKLFLQCFKDFGRTHICSCQQGWEIVSTCERDGAAEKNRLQPEIGNWKDLSIRVGIGLDHLLKFIQTLRTYASVKSKAYTLSGAYAINEREFWDQWMTGFSFSISTLLS